MTQFLKFNKEITLALETSITLVEVRAGKLCVTFICCKLKFALNTDLHILAASLHNEADTFLFSLFFPFSFLT
jgi:hypothetical protein